jgi:hypothetical protein
VCLLTLQCGHLPTDIPIPLIIGSVDSPPLKEGKEVHMATLTMAVEEHPKFIIAVLGLVIVFFLAACLLHEVIPICHWVFGCDHGMHSV